MYIACFAAFGTFFLKLSGIKFFIEDSKNDRAK